jgi:hypothetical protein
MFTLRALSRFIFNLFIRYTLKNSLTAYQRLQWYWKENIHQQQLPPWPTVDVFPGLFNDVSSTADVTSEDNVATDNYPLQLIMLIL